MPCSPTSRTSSSGSVRRRPDPSPGCLSPAPLTPLAYATADYTTLKQCQRDFDLARIRQAIREIGLTLAELDMNPQAYLTRSFCILELFATVDADATLEAGGGTISLADAVLQSVALPPFQMMQFFDALWIKPMPSRTLVMS